MSAEHTEQAVDVPAMPRRVVVKSAAWSLPVFAAVAVTPAFAASGDLTHKQLLASRGKESAPVSFVWDLTFSGAGSPSIASVQFGGLDPSPTYNITGMTLTFSIPAGKGNTTSQFTATVILTNNVRRTFTISAAQVSPNAANVEVGVTP